VVTRGLYQVPCQFKVSKKVACPNGVLPI